MISSVKPAVPIALLNWHIGLLHGAVVCLFNSAAFKFLIRALIPPSPKLFLLEDLGRNRRKH